MIRWIVFLLFFPLCLASGEGDDSALDTAPCTEVIALDEEAKDCPDCPRKKAGTTEDAANSRNPSIIEHLESEPSSFVGKVNVVTGAYQEFSQDILIPGPEPLAIQRMFCQEAKTDGAFYDGWMLNHAGWYTLESKKPFKAILSGAFGSCRAFKGEQAPKKGMAPMRLSMRSIRKGLSNTASGHISGRTNIKNQSFQSDRHGDCGVLTTGNGSTIHYQKTPEEHLSHHPDYPPIFNPNALIRTDTKLNGNTITYEYDNRNRIKTISTVSPGGQLYAYVTFGYPGALEGDYHLYASDGRSIHYRFSGHSVNKFEFKWLLRKVEWSDRPKEKYEYCEIRKGVYAMTKKILPENRYLETCYRRGGKLLYEGKVISQRAPLGTDATPITMLEFAYSRRDSKGRGDNYTDVFDALKHKTRYHFSVYGWLTSITPYAADGSAYRIEQFRWGDPPPCSGAPQSPKEGNLISRVIKTPDGIILGGKGYQYDKRGNVLKETLFGNLTGINPVDPALDDAGYPIDNECHQYIVSYRYTDDGRNLVLEEAYPNGKKVVYRYQGNTDLIKSRLTYDKDRLALREFFTYDANTVLVESIRDDGMHLDPYDLTGVTERLITRTQPRRALPCVGFPEVVAEYGLDPATGKELLIKKLVNEYDSTGHLRKQHHYDSNDVFVYTLLWEYDEKGRLFWERNAIGEISYRHFDRNGNRTLEQGPDPRYETRYEYDYMNRLIREEVVQRDGTRFGVSHRYDFLGNRIASVDGYGRETLYTYDAFSRLITEKKPCVVTPEGTVISPTTHYAYDRLGYCTSITDPRGLRTEKAYNLRGDPLAIHYPDGTAEYFSYTLDGKVERFIEKTGNQIAHAYDFLGRLTNKKIYSAGNAALLSEATATYNTFHLISEVDAAGVETQYTYDHAGRMASKTCGDARTTYHYDSLGRLSESRDWLDSDRYQAHTRLYDLLNRVIEERIEDEKGIIYSATSFGYDCHGKQTSVKQENHVGLALTTTAYDPYGRPAEVVDAEGNKTVTEYNDSYRNELGQNVLQTKRTDPLGNQILTTYDALDRVSSIICKNAFGQKTRDQQVFYDLGNQKARHVETVITPGQPERLVISLCEYDKGNRLIHFVEGAGSAEEKHTCWSYDHAGRQEKTIKPDGTILFQQYNPMGLLSETRASDGSFHYVYHYNERELPVQVEDTVTNTKTLRTYHENGRLEEEILGNGLVVRYTYDPLGRPLTITLPDASSLAYSYQGPYLHTIERFSSEGESLYTHAYTERDLSGHVIREELINGAMLDHKYDLLGRFISSRTAKWAETDIAYDPAGNLVKRKIMDTRGETPYTYAYDDLYQLSSDWGLSHDEYEYDSLHNRVKKDDYACAVNSLNQMTSDSLRHYSYDLNGNRIIKEKEGIEVLYAYDALDRLVKVTDQGSIIAFTYDAFNRCIARDDGISRVEYLYLGQNEVGAYTDGTMTELRILGTGQGAEIGAAVAMEIDGQVFTPLHDHNGNVTALLDGDGEIIQSYHYTAFGEVFCLGPNGKLPEKMLTPWLFSSKRHDPKTGLIHFGRRVYDPKMGSWLTPDPIGPEGGPNLYAYVCNNPLTHFDQYGLFSLGDVFRPIAQFLGWLITTTSYEGIPLVLVKDVFGAIGHILSGNGVDSFIASYREQHSTVGWEGNNDDTTQPMNTTGNGIHTTKDDLTDRANAMSKILGGQKVCYAYNASHGFTTDILEWLGQRLGFPTNSAQKLADCIREEWAVNPGRRICLWLHSQGGEIGAFLKKMLTPEELSLIEVNTFGSANLFEKGHFAKVTHYVSTRDWVPLLGNPIQYLKACLGARSDVTFLKAINSNFFDHSYEGDTYQAKVIQLLNNIKPGVL